VSHGTDIYSRLITTPTDLIKIQQQNSLLQTSSVKSIVSHMYRQRGIRGFYRGITATALREVGYGAYFCSVSKPIYYTAGLFFRVWFNLQYEATCRVLTPAPSLDHAVWTATQSGPSWSTCLIAGAVAGIVGWLATFPMDVVKTRIQGSDWTPAASTQIKSPEREHLLSSTLLGRESLADTVIDNNQPYRTTLSTIVNSYQAEGISVFYRGLSPTLIRYV
jgi:solute carrier family 25 carnitine/acylcarnitine transporter 20/29